MTMARRDQPLYRDTSEKMIGGVCSGLAQYFDIDTVLVRVAFVVFTALGGGGVLAYLILWLVLNPAPPADPAPPLERPSSADDIVVTEAEPRAAIDEPPAEVEPPAEAEQPAVDEPSAEVEQPAVDEPPAEVEPPAEAEPITER